MGSFSKIKTAPSGTFTKISTGEIIKPQSVQPVKAQPAAQTAAQSSVSSVTAPAGGTEAILRSAADDMWNRGSRYSGAGSSGLREAQKDRLRQLEGRRAELTAGLDLEGAAALDNDINVLRKRLGRTLPQQTVKTVSGMAKAIPAGLEGAAGSMANAWTAFYQGGQGGRDVQNREYLQEYFSGLSQAKRDMELMLKENRAKPGSWNDRDIQSQQYIIDDWQRKYDAMSKVVGEDIQRQATRESYGVADTLAADSARRLEEAKQDVAAPGRVLIDATGSLIQNAADLGVNALLGTPGSMGTFAMRAFGGGAQQARQEMEAMGTADQEGAFEKQLAYGLASMTKEIVTEKMFGLSAPFGAAYGKGSLDDLAQDAVNRAVSRFARTAAGKRALERGLNFVNSAASEGLEELIGDWMEWQLPRIYGGEVDTAQEVLENSIYDFLVGAASGGLGDVTYRGAGRALDAITGNTARNTGAQFRAMGKDVVQATIDEGLSSAEGTISKTMAQELQSKLDRGEAVSDREIGRLYQANLEAIEAENAVQQQVQQEAQTGQAPTFTQAAQEAAQTQTREMTRQAPKERTEVVRALDTARVERASSALGENGQKALNATYDGQTRAQEYYGGFSAYYQAGVSGQNIGKVRSEYGQYLTPAQQYAAYSAGKNDAAVSLAREKEAAKFAPVSGEKSGLVYDDFVRQAVESGRTVQDVNQETRTYLTADTAERINTLAKDLGVRVRFVDSVAQGRANAQIRGSEVLVERNNPNPVMAIVGHELTHRMQQLAPEAYRQFRDIVMQEEGQSDRVQQRISDYGRQGVTLDTEAAMDEVAADYAGRMMDDGNVLDDFIRKNRDNRTVLEKLRDAFRALWEKLTGKEKNQARQAEKKLAAALEAATVQAEQNRQTAAQTEGEKTKHSLKDTDSQGRELTKEQREFFGDSKITDAEGQPLVLYHGTTAYGDITKFRRGRSGWLGPGIYLSSRQADAQRYADAMGEGNGKLYELYANVTNPLVVTGSNPVPEILRAAYGRDSVYQARSAKQGNDTKIITPADIKKLQSKGYDGIRWDFGKSTEVSVFSPEQIKRVDNKAPTESPDIRYSLKEGTISKSYEALLRENDALRERVDYWKNQTKRTQRITTDKKAVEQAARALIRDYGAQIELEDIRGDLQSLYDYISSGSEGKNELTYTEARRRAKNIAQTLVENAVAVEDTLYQDYQDLRKHLRNIKLTISEADSHDIRDFNDFRKRNFGRMNIGKGRTNIDQVYQDLAEMWPGLFNEQEHTNPADQLYHIAEVLDTISATQEYNPFSGDMRNAVAGAANEIMERFFDLPQTKATFADKQAAKIDKLRGENQERVQRAIARERGVRERQLQRLKNHYAQVQRNQAERRADSEARTRLLKIAKRLQNKKLPAVSRALLDQYIGDLDTTAKSMTGKTLERLSELKDWYAEQKENDPDFIADPAIEKELERLSKRQIGDMTAEEVADLTRVLLNIENELRTKRQLIDSEDRRDIYLQGVQAINDIENSGGNKEGGVMGAIDKYIVTETLSPLRQIKRMAGYAKDDPLIKLTNALADGQRASLSYQMEAEKPFQKWAENKKFSRDFSGDKAKTIEITGLVAGKGPTTLEITPAMRASLYLHSLNDQNLRHIQEGGITVPDMKLYKQGKIAEAYARGTTIKLTPSQVRSITANMTMEEKAFAKAVHDYFNGQSRNRINEVSEKLKGYSIAQVENYFPINTDTSFTRSDFETLKFDGTLEGMGFLKERMDKAANPIYLRDVNDVLQKSIDQHSKYVGLAIPVRNFNKVWGVTKSSFNDDGSRNSYEGSVQKAVKKAWGESGYNYVEKMMTDLQGGGKQKDVWVKALNKIRSSYAGAVLTLNASVAMKQAASYPTAAAVLGWGPLARAMADTGRVNLDTIAKYTPLQWYRSKGFSTKELGDLRKSGGPIAKVMNNLPPILNWVQGADLITTRKLWKASEYYVKANNKELSPGTDAYYRAVADIYNRVIEETQPNYTTMQRPQLLRSDDTLMGNLAMFKTQPFQNFNILYDAVREYIAAKKNGVDVKTAKKNLGNAVTSQLAQLAVFAGMTMAWALFRGRREKYEDEEGEMSLQSVASALGKDMIGGQLSTVPFGSDAWELVSSKLFGNQYYGMDAVTVTAISDTISSLNGMGELIGSTLKSVSAGEDVNWNSARIKLDGYMDDISKAAGVPYENVVNLFNAGYRHTCIAALGKYQGEYAALKLTADPEKKASTYYDLLYKAMKQAPEQYDAMYRDMVDSGSFPADKIGSAMETRMKDDQGVEKVSELDQRYLSPEQEREYSRMQEEISGTKVWRSATAEQRSAAEEDLYNIVSGNKSGEKLTEKISGGSSYGIDETDYILYRLALRIADQPTESGKLGTYTNEEVEKAINMLSGLSNDARSYLWEAQGRSEKSNPYG